MRPFLTALFIVCSITIITATDTSLARAKQSTLDPGDAIRIAEAFSLASFIGDSVWEGWSETPFPILLLTPEKDYLIGHPFPTDDFTSEGIDERVGGEVFSRPRTESWGLNMLATFPAVAGLTTVVVGQASATGKSSTEWVLTLIHEHFHQYQFGWERYFESVGALDLAGGDETGMWMLNYPFPYEDEAVVETILRLRDDINSFLNGRSSRVRIGVSLNELKSQVSEKDFRYFTFQLWQEGVARYTEQEVANLASDGFISNAAFAALPDAVTYEEAFSTLLVRRSEEMKSLNPAKQGRVVFYALGSALASVLESTNPSWRDDYFESALDLVGLFPCE
jgi:hypothetical protein